WSSDVCSSDLIRSRPGPMPTASRRPENCRSKSGSGSSLGSARNQTECLSVSHATDRDANGQPSIVTIALTRPQTGGERPSHPPANDYLSARKGRAELSIGPHNVV